VDLFNNKILFTVSSGKYKINTTKKRLKYNLKIIIKFFLRDIKKYTEKSKKILVDLILSLRIRKFIFRVLRKEFQKKHVVVHLKENKCFNGCRSVKKKRKKGLKFKYRIFK